MPLAVSTRLRRPGGVDEPPHLAVQLDQRVDGVDGRAGDVVDDRAGLPGQPVEQAGLADVGLADQRHTARATAGRRPRSRGLSGSAASTRRAGRPSRARAGRSPGAARRARAATARRCRPSAGRRRPWWRRAGPDGPSGAAPARRPRRWSVAPTLASTTSSTASAVCIASSAWAATAACRPVASGSQPPVSTSGEPAPVPQRVVGDPVAGDARHVLHDRLAAPDQAVDQRRLARRSGARRRRAPACGGSRRSSPDVAALVGDELAGSSSARGTRLSSGRRSRTARVPRPLLAPAGQRGAHGLGSRRQPGPVPTGGQVSGSPTSTSTRGRRRRRTPSGRRVPRHTTGSTLASALRASHAAPC